MVTAIGKSSERSYIDMSPAERHDLARHIKEYAAAAKDGDMDAVYHLAVAFIEGIAVPRDRRMAFSLYRQLAASGDVRGIYGVGWCLSHGVGVRKNQKAGFRSQLAAAKLGFAAAQYSVGVRYSFGEGVRQNARRAWEWYGRAAKQGHVDAMYNLGHYCKVGRVSAPDFKAAARWYRMAAKRGHAGAWNSLGYLYFVGGNGLRKNLRVAHNCFAEAAKQRDPGGMYNVGLAYLKGESVPKSKRRALLWLRRAAKAGHVGANRLLAIPEMNAVTG